MRNRFDSKRRSDRGATLADVAAVAGVSASTASRALNGRGELAPETRAAVLEAAAALEFQPSLLARSLRTRTTYTVGFVVPDIASPFYAAALKGAQAVLEQAGYRVMLMDSELGVQGELAALRTLLNHQVDGLLLSTTGISRRLFDDVVGRRGSPCVFFDGVLSGAGAGSVSLENAEGIAMLVDHLVDHGHRRVALLAGAQEETSGRERLVAFRSAMRRHGLPVARASVRVCRWTQDDVRRQTLALLDAESPPTAIVASSAELALGALAACRERAIRLPDTLALASFDDPYFGALLEPPLTAVAYDPGEVGRAAAGVLVEALAQNDRGNGRHDIRIPVHLIARRSCGCTA